MEIILSPVTRISGFLTVVLKVDNNVVVDAECKGTMYRGFEKLLVNKFPSDAIYLTQRICGICSSAHSIASSRALEDCCNIEITYSAKLIRNIIHAFDILQNHIRQFYLFSVPDFVNIEGENFLNRIPREIEIKINENYIRSLYISTIAHQGLSIFGGKAPHNHGIIFGGVTTKVTSYELAKAIEITSEIVEFTRIMIDDYYIIERYYGEYSNIGDTGGNYLSFGLFDDTPDFEVSKSGSILDKVYNKLNLDYLVEYNVSDDISFIKAPRYKGIAVEVGPLARYAIKNGFEKSSTLNRIKARVYEAHNISIKLLDMLSSVELSGNSNLSQVTDGNGIGITDTIRGTLYHNTTVTNKRISQYNIITPSAFNLSPTYNNVKGALEKALIGTYIENLNNPIEVNRTIHSFDPCVSCATHIISKDGVILNEGYFMHR